MSEEVIYRIDYPMHTLSWVDRFNNLPVNDLIVKLIKEILPENHDSIWCVELGAWDGREYSHLYEVSQSFVNMQCVMIEGDPKKFIKLQQNHSCSKYFKTLEGYVGWEAHNHLDNFLKSTKIPHNFDFMIIDIDGNDYHIVESLNNYLPSAFMIEFNPSIPNNVVYIQKRNIKINKGCSLLALVNLLKKRGYQLIGTRGPDAFFVKNELLHKFNMEAFDINLLHDDSKLKMVFFQLYDGTLLNAGFDYMLWHGIKIERYDIQVLPMSYRKYFGPEFRNVYFDKYNITNCYPQLKLKIDDIHKSKNLLVWGAGGRFKNFLKKYKSEINEKKVQVVDINKNLKDTEIHGYKIEHTEYINFDQYDMIIICTDFVDSVLCNIAEKKLCHKKIKYFQE